MVTYRIVANQTKYEVICGTSFSTLLFNTYHEALVFVQTMQSIVKSVKTSLGDSDV